MVGRPALVQRLVEGLSRRLTVVVASAGSGKSVLLGQVASSRSHVHVVTVSERDREPLRLARRVAALCGAAALAAPVDRGPDGATSTIEASLAGMLCDHLAEQASGDRFVLVLDDVHEIDGHSAWTFVEALVRHAPPSVSLVLAGRTEPPMDLTRLAGQGHLARLDGSALAFSHAEVADALNDLSVGADVSTAVAELTGGWPALVALAAEYLASVPADGQESVIADLAGLEGPFADYLSTQVLADLSLPEHDVLQIACVLGAVEPELAAALGVAAPRRHLARLSGRAAILHREDDGRYAPSTLVADAVNAELDSTPTRVRSIRTMAIEWALSQGDPDRALALALANQDHGQLRSVLSANGLELLRTGTTQPVLDGLDLIEDLDAPLLLLRGETRRVIGDWDGALADFVDAAGDGPMRAAVAWRMGLVHHMRGDVDAAMEAYGRGTVDAADHDDRALLLAWHATACWLRGETDQASDLAGRAQQVVGADRGVSKGSDTALAVVHAVLAVLAADRDDPTAHDRHEGLALAAAARAGDVLVRLRLLINRSAVQSERGQYVDMQATLDEAIDLATRTGYIHFLALALVNRADAAFRVGRLDDSMADLTEAQAIFARLGSDLIAYAQFTAGQVHLVRGEEVAARVALSKAIDLGERNEDQQVLLPALAHLARVEANEDEERARALLARSLAGPETVDRPAILLDAAWVELVLSDLRQARIHAQEALSHDTRGPVRAEASLVDALAASPIDVPGLLRAQGMWRELGDKNGVLLAGAALALARVPQGKPGRHEAVDAAFEALQQAGAHGHVGLLRRVVGAMGRDMDEVAVRTRGGPTATVEPTIRITTLGSFGVVVGGQAVAAGAWGSRQAREILKMLVAAPELRVPREVLCDRLWPDEHNAAKLANRLSVALSALRKALGAANSDLLVSRDGVVELAQDTVSVDVHRFLAAVANGRRLAAEGREADAVARWTVAEQAYTGEFLADMLYADWAAPLRQEALAAYLDLTRELGSRAAAAGDHELSARLARRGLERDPYDEDAHLRLVAALEHGGRRFEARRSFQHYAQQMAELGVEPATYPSASVA